MIADRRVAAFVVAVVLLFATVCGFFATRVEHDHDVLAFLPEDNEEIAVFRAISERFGGLDVALVGVETEDVYDPGFLGRLRTTTREIREIPQVDHVVSLANVEDFAPDPAGGIRSAPLVDDLPTDATSRAVLRALVQSRDAVVGTLVNEQGTAIVLYIFAAPGSDLRTTATLIQDRVEAGLGDETFYWGGNPFVSTYIYDATQADMARLTPWAVATILLIMLVSFRDPLGAGAGLFATGVGILATRAAMAVLEVPLNVVLSSMPILLFAIGSAYGIHLLSRYQVYAAEMAPGDAVERTLTQTGPVVLTAGLTTMAGLSSFVFMDIAPLRTFGLFSALGIGVALLVSLTFVPAVAVLARLKGRPHRSRPLALGLTRLVAGIHRARPTFAIVLGLLALGGLGFTGRVDTRMDQTAFYTDDSPPALADAFLAEHFGGSVFVQLVVEGDLSNPHVLREVQRLADEIHRLDDVSSVQHVGQVIGLLNLAMEGSRRIPDEQGKVRALFGLMTGHGALRQLVTENRESGMLVVRLATNDLDEIEKVLSAIEETVATAPTRLSVLSVETPGATTRRSELTRTRLAALVPSAPVQDLEEALALPPQQVDPTTVAAELARWLAGPESPAPLENDLALDVAAVLVQLDEHPEENQVQAALTAALEVGPEDPRVQDLSWSVSVPLEEAWRNTRARTQASALSGLLGLLPSETLLQHLQAVVLDSQAPTVGVADPGGELDLDWVVSGLPVMHRGLSQSVAMNQFRSVLFALILVVVLLSVAFRSFRAGLIATSPTLVTLLVVYGAMGAMGVHLDIGTSMLAGLIIGAGVDYGVHLQSNWVAGPLEPLEHAAARATARTSKAIWTNALMVAAGFAVLTLGEARPLRNVGGLTATAMLVAACMTFVAIPVLANRKRYSERVEVQDPADPLFRAGVG